MDLKKIYYYIICLVALFVLFWGLVDLAGAVAGLSTARLSPSIEQPIPGASETPAEQSLDMYYQRKMFGDRLVDSLARIIIAGAVFAYSRIKVGRLEG
jgi:hypothetical protein